MKKILSKIQKIIDIENYPNLSKKNFIEEYQFRGMFFVIYIFFGGARK